MSPEFRPDGRPDDPAGLHEERRAQRSSWLGTGSLACPECDAPAYLFEASATTSTALGCSYCDHTGTVRDFLSLAQPPRPQRVNVFVRMGRG